MLIQKKELKNLRANRQFFFKFFISFSSHVLKFPLFFHRNRIGKINVKCGYRSCPKGRKMRTFNNIGFMKVLSAICFMCSMFGVGIVDNNMWFTIHSSVFGNMLTEIFELVFNVFVWYIQVHYLVYRLSITRCIQWRIFIILCAVLVGRFTIKNSSFVSGITRGTILVKAFSENAVLVLSLYPLSRFYVKPKQLIVLCSVLWRTLECF